MDGRNTQPDVVAWGGCLPEPSGAILWSGISLRGLRSGLCLMATPVFLAMAAICVLFPGEMAAICATGDGAFPITGMAMMYVLMGVFHAGAWLKLAERRTDPEINQGDVK